MAPAYADGWIVGVADAGIDTVPTIYPIQTATQTGIGADAGFVYGFIYTPGVATNGVVGAMIVNGFPNNSTGSIDARLAYGLQYEAVWSGPGYTPTHGLTMIGVYNYLESSTSSSNTGTSAYAKINNGSGASTYAPRANRAGFIGNLISDHIGSGGDSSDTFGSNGYAYLTTGLGNLVNDEETKINAWIQIVVVSDDTARRNANGGRVGFSDQGTDVRFTGGGNGFATSAVMQSQTFQVSNF